MKIDARLNEEASGGGDQQPPWDPNNPPFWWNPNTPVPPGYPPYPADMDGDGEISISEWLVWTENLMRAWAEENEDQDDPTAPRGRGVPEWVGRGGLPTHYYYNPWLILPVGQMTDEDGNLIVDFKDHPLYALFLYYRENWKEFRDLAGQYMADFLRSFLLSLGLPESVVDGIVSAITNPILLLFFGSTGDFDDFISMLRFFWNPHIPDSILDRLGLVGDLADFFFTYLSGKGISLEALLLLIRAGMLQQGGGLADGPFGEILRAASDGGMNLYIMPGEQEDGIPQFTPEGYLEGGTWFFYNGNWYYIPPINTYTPDMPPEVIDRPPQPELTPPPDPFDHSPPGSPISPLAQVEGEFAKAFARYNKGMDGKGIR